MRCAASTRPSAGAGRRGPGMEWSVASARCREVAWKIRNEQRLGRRQHLGNAHHFESVAVGVSATCCDPIALPTPRASGAPYRLQLRRMHAQPPQQWASRKAMPPLSGPLLRRIIGQRKS
jgi:hypothetical protein